MHQRADEKRQQHHRRVGLGGQRQTAQQRIACAEPDPSRAHIASKAEHRAGAQQDHQVDVVNKLRKQQRRQADDIQQQRRQSRALFKYLLCQRRQHARACNAQRRIETLRRKIQLSKRRTRKELRQHV